MAQSKELQPWFRADINFVSLADGVTVKTMSFVNRTADSGTTTYWPILKAANAIGGAVDQNGMPTQISGTVILHDMPGSFGEYRRIADLLEHYTPIMQAVQIYYVETTLNDQTVPSAWTSYWKGQVLNWEKQTTGEQDLTFNVQTVPIDKRYFCKFIDGAMAATGFSVPSTSLGKTLPIAFKNTNLADPGDPLLTFLGSNSISFPAYSIKDGAADGQYAWAANLGTQFKTYQADNEQTVYVQGTDGKYVALSALSENLNTAGSNAVASYGKTEFMVPLISGGGSVVTGVKWWCKGQSSGGITPTGYITFTLYQRDGSTSLNGNGGWTAVKSMQVNKADYLTSVRGASDFWVYAVFATPFITTQNSALAVGVIMDQFLTSTTDFTSAGVTTQFDYFYRTGDGLTYLTGNYSPLVDVGVASVTGANSSAIDSSGFSFAYLSFAQPAWVTAKCDLTGLNVTVAGKGILGDGTVAATNVHLSTVQHALTLAGYRWSGSTWAASGDYDVSTYDLPGSVYLRQPLGFVDGAITVEDFVSTLIAEMSAVLIPTNNGKLSLWSWGTRRAVVKTFTDESCNVLTYRQLDRTSVVNQVKLGYSPNFTNTNPQWAVTGALANNLGAIVYKTTDVDSANISNTLYGVQELDQTGTKLCGDTATVRTLAHFILRKKDAPPFVISMTVPFYENRTLEDMQIIDVVSTKLPAHAGTNYNSIPPNYSGTQVDIYKGRNPARCGRYRCHIIGKTVDFDSANAPILTLDLEAIQPTHPDDFTADAIKLIGT